ncbi:MAG: FAD-dependent oxidoreductase [Oscillospiraceae bacterium]|nr:FAD-dependent oxidoreductase [Oscillospiraceae bacterium]
MNEIIYTKTIREKYTADVCVIGGGPAGIAAAVSAARQGVSVFLAESQGFFGGLATTALVPAFMSFTDGVNFLAGGIGREVYDLCIENGFNGLVGIHVEKYKRLCDNLIVNERNIKYSFFTTLIDVIKNGEDHVNYAVFNAKSGTFAVRAKIFIDCTGDGDLCAFAGNPYVIGGDDGRTMPSTLCTIWNNINWGDKNFTDDSELEKAFADNIFTQEDRHLSGMWRVGDNLGGGNIGHCFDADATDEVSLTQAMITGRKILPEYEKYYREYLGRGYKNANIVISGSCLGVRESRRITGDYELCADDFIKRASFNDEIGRFSYPVDIHIAKPDKESYEKFRKEYETMRYKTGESYGIPYRILLPKNLSNVYVAGRCASTDKKMQASIRVMPGCFIMGQAAGIGAAISAANTTANGVCETRSVNILELQQKLKDIGAYLPNAR